MDARHAYERISQRGDIRFVERYSTAMSVSTMLLGMRSIAQMRTKVTCSLREPYHVLALGKSRAANISHLQQRALVLVSAKRPPENARAMTNS